MEFKLAEIRVEDVFNKSVDDIFLDVLDYVYDITRRQYGSKADFKSRTSYWKYDDNDTYDYFVGVLKCIALSISNINYTVEDMEVDVSGDFKFEDVYRLSCDYVFHDEHILTAYKFEYINGYHVFCELPDYELSDYESYDRRRHINAFYHARSDIRSMADEEIQKLGSIPFILDFDLDYFTS